MDANPPHSLIFVSLEPWDEIWRRNQFFCAELARRDRRRRIVFVGPAADLSAAVRRRTGRELGRRGAYNPTNHPNITVTRPDKFLPNTLAPTRRINQAMVRRHVRRAARRLGFHAEGRRPVLWLNPPTATHLAGRMGEAGVVYDITDDWTRFGDDTPARRRLTRDDERLSHRADAIIVCSEDLADSKRDFAAKVTLIPNGVDFEHYRPAREPAGPAPRPDRAGPWLGYTGTIHRDRLDVDLVESLAKRMDAGAIELIGPNHLDPRERSRLEATGRVSMPGPVPYAELPARMRRFDVCIVPHRVTPFTESLNPIKLWEYLASGKPIVSTPVAGFRDYPQHVRLASDAASFLAAVREAGSDNGAHAEARRALAREHSWARRVDAVEGVLAAVASRPATGEPTHA